MDFRSRGVQSTTPVGGSSPTGLSSVSNKTTFASWMERSSVILLFAIAILILALTGLTFFSGNAENKAVKKNDYQAVFLTNGQVYFGNIEGLNSKFINLQHIYYLQTNGSSTDQTAANSSSNVSLVKLGCELHAPFDQMVINRDQVLFWENLQDNGQVVKAIAKYKSDNKNGQTCSSSSNNSTQQAPSTSGTTQSTTTQTPTPTATPTRKP